VVCPGFRQGFLAEAYGLDLVRLSPKAKGAYLVFLTVRLGLDEEDRPIHRIRMNTKTLEASVRKIATLEALKAGKRHRSIVA
jgi:hypothetical protein